MNIAADCPDCCVCPSPIIEWDSVSVSQAKYGFTEYGAASTPPKRYTLELANGTFSSTASSASFEYISAGYEISRATGIQLYSAGNACKINGLLCDRLAVFVPDSASSGNCNGVAVTGRSQISSRPRSTDDCTSGLEGGDGYSAWLAYISAQSSTSKTWTGCSEGGTSGTVTVALTDEFTTADLKALAVASMAAFDEDWNDTAGTLAALSTDELTYVLRDSRYRFRVPLHKIGTGKCYRIRWDVQAIPKTGVPITSLELWSRGVYRPAVTLSAPPAGGTQARAVAVMASGGSVASIRILHPGSGYTSAPTVTVAAAINGGTTATATASISAGQVTAITVGTAGNYLPQLTIGGGGTGATATCTLDPQGGIASVSLGASGSGYTTAPAVTITPRVSGAVSGDILAHAGTETSHCEVWDGTTLAGRWVTRVIDPAGHAISSIEVVHPGNFLPRVVFTGGGGAGAKATVTGLSSAGEVTAISLDEPGEGYTSAPTVSIVGRDGTSNAVVTATLDTSGSLSTAGGRPLLSLSLTSGGDYRPTISISGGGGTGATAEAVMTAEGAISSITLTAGGSGYRTNPSIIASGGGNSLLAAHFGTETEYTDGSEPMGAVPVGYVDSEPSTYPVIGDTSAGDAPYNFFPLPAYNESDEPIADGLIIATNVRGSCDCSTCP